MNSPGFEGSGHDLIQCSVPAFAWRDCIKPRNASVRTDGGPDGFRAKYLPNSAQSLYLYSELGELHNKRGKDRFMLNCHVVVSRPA